MNFKLSCLAFVFLLLMTATSQAKAWRGIVPLKSTRADVERLLGLPGKYGHYEFPNETASIYYFSEAGCKDLHNCLCVSPKDIVAYIYTGVSVPMKISDLNLDMRRYKKFRSPRSPHQTTYTDDDEGITYTVAEDGEEVLLINYYESKSDCEALVKSVSQKRKAITN